MFEHSVKVPRTYKKGAAILKQVLSEGASLKSLLYDDKVKFFRTNALYALVSEALKHNNLLDKLFEHVGLLSKEARLDPFLAKILTTELLFGKKLLPGKSKPETTITSYKEQFESYPELSQEVLSKAPPKPRYVRINTNILTTSDAIRAFQDEDYNFVRCTSGSYDDYLQQIQGLGEYDFTQDYHIKTIFVFAPGTKFFEHELVTSGQILLQDKATALAPFLLAPPPGSIVLDMCAAPGMKTSQVAAMMKNEGKVYSVEMNPKRFEILNEFVERTKSSCVETINRDILQIRRGEYEEVEYILLDPSCSGSGMNIRAHNYQEETRIAKLTSLQEKLLKHAMYAFPKAKRIVYSTCSLLHEENERVVANVINHCKRSKWRVQNAKELLKDKWNNVGSGMFGSVGMRCIYSKPETDLTTGFFLAVIDRDPKDFEKMEQSDEVFGQNPSQDLSKKVQNGKPKKLNDGADDVERNVQDENEKRKAKKRKKDQTVLETSEETNLYQENNVSVSQDDDNNTEVKSITKEVENSSKKKKASKSKKGLQNNEIENTNLSSSKNLENDKDVKVPMKSEAQVELNDNKTSELSSKKKKKNSNLKNVEEVESASVIIENHSDVAKIHKGNNTESVAKRNNDIISEDGSKKKKKKGKKENGHRVESSSPLNADHCKDLVKSKPEKYSEAVIDANIDSISEDVPKKKKKKDKSSLIEANDEIANSNSSSAVNYYEGVKTKTMKTETVDLINADEPSECVPKKKKKKVKPAEEI